jgi:hypothetical protein
VFGSGARARFASRSTATLRRADRAPRGPVREDVFAGRGEVVVAFDDPGGVAISEQVAGALVPLVEAESMDAVQALHPQPQLRNGRVDDEVVVRRHQAERVDGPVEAGDALSEQAEEGQAVGVVAVDRATIDAARRSRGRRRPAACGATVLPSRDGNARRARHPRMWKTSHTIVAKDRPPSVKGQVPFRQHSANTRVRPWFWLLGL